MVCPARTTTVLRYTYYVMGVLLYGGFRRPPGRGAGRRKNPGPGGRAEGGRRGERGMQKNGGKEIKIRENPHISIQKMNDIEKYKF